MANSSVVERPILFSAPMVRAILEGRKTQTRRVMKHPEYMGCLTGDCPHTYQSECDLDVKVWASENCPYGVPGDRLWVKETFRLRADMDDRPPSLDWWKKGAWYEADGPNEPSGCAGGAGKLRPSIFMPRWASRITLEITEVRVLRVQEISEEDAKAEGVFGGCTVCGDSENGDCIEHTPSCTDGFANIWMHINGEDSWHANPWVWALTFKRVEVSR